MKVLITGSTGFVGNNLIDYLHAQGIAISVVNRGLHSHPKVTENYIWDNLSVDKLLGIDAVIHLAGKAHDLANTSMPQDYFNINTGLTQTVFDLFLQSQVTTFIYFSSVKAVADTVSGWLTEDAAYEAKTAYGQSKQQAEEYLLKQELPQDKRCFILRPCMIHGPGNKGNLNLLYKFVTKNMPYPLAAFENRRSFLSIDNLSFVVTQLITNNDIKSGVYNIADDDALSTNRVIEIIAAFCGTKTKLWAISPAFIKAAAKLGDILHLPLNSERLKKLTESYMVSNNKIKSALNIQRMPVSSFEGLTTTIKSFSS